MAARFPRLPLSSPRIPDWFEGVEEMGQRYLRGRERVLEPPEAIDAPWMDPQGFRDRFGQEFPIPAQQTAARQTRTSDVNPQVREAILGAARRYGVSSQLLMRFAQTESNFNPNAVSPSGNHFGLFQLSRDVFNRFGSGNINEPAANANAAAAHLRDNARRFESRFGRTATPADLYMIHQQGFAGYAAHLANPDQPAWKNLRPYYSSDAVAQRAVTGNLPPELRSRGVNITSGEFTRGWAARFMPGDASPSLRSPQPQERTPSTLPTGGTAPDEATRRMMRRADTPDPFGGPQAGTEIPISPVSPAPSPVARPPATGVEPRAEAARPPGAMESQSRGRPRIGMQLLESLLGPAPGAPPSTDDWLSRRFPQFGQLFAGGSGGANFTVNAGPGAGGWANAAFNPGPV